LGDLRWRSGLFPSRQWTLAPTACLPSCTPRYSEFGSRPPSPSSALPPRVITRRSTSIDFAENQLLPALIGLSPLATGHPLLLQQKWVRSSSAC
ncbi:unnamed protein product, partial [Phaeothamnion confervicola]